MSAKLLFFCICLCVWTSVSSSPRFQGPAGEVITRPPPAPVVDDKAVARAEAAMRLRRKAAIADQFELVLKRANAAVDKCWPPGPNTSTYASEAKAEYQHAAKLKPADWRVAAGLGRLHMITSEYHDAVPDYQRAITLKPNDALLYLRLGESYGLDYQTPEGIRRSKEIQALARSVELDPSAKNYDAYTKLGRAYNDAKLPEKAIDIYKRLLVVLPPNDVKEMLEAHDSLGSAYKNSERFPEAIEEYKAMIRLRPDFGAYYRELGDVYGEAKQYDKGAQAFARSTELDPEYWGGFMGLGMCYYLQKQYAMSLDPFKQAIRLRPEDDGSHYYLGLSQLMLGQKSDAMQQYEELRKLKSELADKLLSEINKQ
jgi:tetratricopeptide (TPR) repeat protein